MHLSLALFRQRASAAALYPPLAQLMQALGLKRLSHGVVIDKTYANGELTHEGKGIRKHALEAGHGSHGLAFGSWNTVSM